MSQRLPLDCVRGSAVAVSARLSERPPSRLGNPHTGHLDRPAASDMRSDFDRASQSAVTLETACLISSRGDRGYQLPCPDASACSAAIRTLSGCHGLGM